MVSSTAFANAPPNAETVAPDPTAILREIEGQELLEKLAADPASDIQVILTGTPHGELPTSILSDRASAIKELDRRAALFFRSVDSITARFGGEVLASWSAAPAIKVAGDAHLMNALAALPEVRHMALDDDDALSLVAQPSINPQSGDEPETQNTKGRRMIQAEEIWSEGFEGEGTRISVIDTGIDGGHEAFKHQDGSSRVMMFADCVSDGCDEGSPFDDNGHGTHVAGTAAGSDVYEDPDHGFYQETGVAPKAELLVAKFLDSGGSGSFQGGMDALQWSFDNGADLTSNSWGSVSCSSAESVIQLVNQLTQLGMVSVFAAGNSGPSSGTINGPACAETAIAVGAVDGNNEIAWFSSRGSCSDPTKNEGDRICPHVVAKGVAVRSAMPRVNATTADPSGYKTWQGTSMATPFVAGAIALMKEMKLEFTGEDWDTANLAERQALMDTASPLGSGSPNNAYGWGLVQLLPILHSFTSGDTPTVTSSLSISVDEVFYRDSYDLSFAVTHEDGALVDGLFRVELERPNGFVKKLEEKSASLASNGVEFSKSYLVDMRTPPGEHVLRGSFDYTWTDGEGVEQTGSIQRTGTFTVLRPDVEMQLDGLDRNIQATSTQDLTFTIDSTGSEAASDLTLRFEVPEEYHFLPGENWDPIHLESRYAQPSPDRVESGLHEDRVTLVWEVGDLDIGESFSFSTRLMATSPGEHWFRTEALFKDSASTNISISEIHYQSVRWT